MQSHLISYEEFLPHPQKKVQKQRDHSYLSNTKFLLYDYDVEATFDKFEMIDSVLREIQCTSFDEEKNELSESPQVIVKEGPKEHADSTPVILPEKVSKKREFIISLPYNISPASISQTIRTAASVHIQEQKSNKDKDAKNVCHHCHSKEVLQQDQLYQNACWRKALEKRLQYKSRQKLKR
jgi:hypothetical protein